MRAADQIAHGRWPAYLQFYPTLRCNYHCDFCFNRHLTDCGDVSVKNFQKMAAVCRRHGIKHIDMLGGEPTLHPRLFDMLDILMDAGLMTTISTNGSRVPVLTQISEKYPREAVQLGVSMNSTSVPDALHQYILQYRPILKSIFSKELLIPESLTPYINLSGIDFYVLYRDVLNEADLKFSLPFELFYERLNCIKALYAHVDGVFCSGFLPDKLNYPALAHVRCPAGTTKLSVLPDGRVYPCYLLFRYPEFELGNIFENDFEQIWRHPVLKEFRGFDENRCPNTSCPLHQECHGGCPAMSYIFFGDLGAPEPRCSRPVRH